ncbi:MAG: hypothetical protein PHF08_11990, partial [Candidatus Riflebacteria bacterium]|nr:hypothetical protein [Candidatus Riflebacteria bacterium]
RHSPKQVPKAWAISMDQNLFLQSIAEVKLSYFQGDALDTEFGENGTAAIGFAINVNGNDLEERFFSFILIFKKVDNKISFNIDDEKDFYNTPDGIINFCEYLFEVAHKSLSNRLKNFLQSPSALNKPIGFRLGSEKN